MGKPETEKKEKVSKKKSNYFEKKFAHKKRKKV